jgi:hypothetical protein
MPFKKHDWCKYGLREMTAKIEVLDEDGRLLDRAKWNIPDKNSERKIFTIFKNKYGLFNPKRKF